MGVPFIGLIVLLLVLGGVGYALVMFFKSELHYWVKLIGAGVLVLIIAAGVVFVILMMSTYVEVVNNSGKEITNVTVSILDIEGRETGRAFTRLAHGESCVVRLSGSVDVRSLSFEMDGKPFEHGGLKILAVRQGQRCILTIAPDGSFTKARKGGFSF